MTPELRRPPWPQGGIERLDEAAEHNLERAMFLLLPLLALVMKPLYLRPPRHYVEHLLFFAAQPFFPLRGARRRRTLLKMVTGIDRGCSIPFDPVHRLYIPIYFYHVDAARLWSGSAGSTLGSVGVRLGMRLLCLRRD